MNKICSHVSHTDDDLLLDAGEECGEPADYECKAFNRKAVYRCAYHTLGIFHTYRRLGANDRE